MAKKAKKSQNIAKSASIRALDESYKPGVDRFGKDKTLFSPTPGVNVDTLYNTVKSCPEVVACISAIVEDIMADGWRFESLVKKGKSKDAIKKATVFQLKAKLFTVLTNALWDLFISGDGYILKLSISEERIKSIIDKLTMKMAKSLNVEVNKEEMYEIVNQEVSAENIKDLQLIKSSTVKINYDDTGKILSYDQDVNGKHRVYKPNDIIHLTLMNIGGEPYGFTPLEALLNDIATLIFAKEYAGKYFENDGIPTFMFKMPKEHPNSPNYEKLRTELRELRKQTNKWKSLVLTGEVEYSEIQKFNKDMEFAKLISHFTQIILMAFGVPAHRVNLTIDVRQIGGAVNRAYEGYYKKINFTQKVIQETLNRDLWSHFKVKMKFKETYKIDELREAQIVQILAQIGSHTIEELREKMGDEPELPKGVTPNKTAPTVGNVETDPNQVRSRRDPNKIEPNQDNQTKAEHKQNFETEKLKLRDQKEFKQLKSVNDDGIIVNWPDFQRIVESKVGFGKFQNANVLYIEINDDIVLFFNDGNWKYKTKIDKTRIKDVTGYETVEKFKVERLTNAIKIFM